MLINQTNLRALYTGFSTAFAGGFAGVQAQYQRVATTVNSTTAENEYGWLGQMPGFREWIGDRQIKSIATHGYSIRNRSFEQTIGVDRDHIEDDNIGIYAPLFTELGRSAAIFPDQLVFAALKDGFAQKCYDGQYFFDTDHPVIDANGASQSVSNSGGGSGTPWFLLDVSRALKPLIFQSRKSFNNLVRKDQETDDNVFDRKEFRYGTDGRCNVGYGFWQMAYGSKQTLDATAYAAARAGMLEMKGDNGRILGINPGLLVVPPSLEGAGRKILQSQLVNGGESNPWANTAELLVVPWLA
jgi:phage major head subunit gpT-like protein